MAAPESTSPLRQVARRFVRNPAAVAGLMVLLCLGLVALFAPQLAREPLDAIHVDQRLRPPGPGHPFGTDNLGRDVLSRLIWGARTSLSVGLVAMSVAVGIGTVVGAVAGFYAGTWVDLLFMRIAEAISIIPVYFLVVTVVAVVRPSLLNVMLVIGLTSWPGPAQIVRAQFLSLRQRAFAEASRAVGVGDARLIFRHILPNASGPIIVSATLGIGNAILVESSLSFLGLGAQYPQTSWGQMLSQGRQFLLQAPWVSLVPGLAIFLVVICFNCVGEGLREALDPKMDE